MMARDKHAHSGVEATDGTRIQPDNLLARIYLRVETLYMDDIIDVCSLEAFLCLSIRNLSHAEQMAISPTHCEKILCAEYVVCCTQRL